MPGFIEAETGGIAEELENHLLGIRPIRTDKEDGQFGIRQVTISEVWILDEDEISCYDVELPVRWQVVQRQLRRTTDEAPWVVGKLVKSGRAFMLQPPTPSERVEIESAMAVIDAMREAPANNDEEPF